MNRQRKVSIDRIVLEEFLHRVRKELKLGAAEVSVAIVSDSEMARLNRKYRGKKGPTDVLSFPAQAQPGVRRRSRSGRDHFLGDIAIAPATARRYARKNGRSLPGELRLLILHGVLHLLGYDHETDRGRMNRIEQKFRRRLGLA